MMNRERWNFLGLALFGGTYGALLDYTHTHGGVIDYPAGTTHERGILTFALVYSVAPWISSQFRMATEKFNVVDEGGDKNAPPAIVDGKKVDNRVFVRENKLAPVTSAMAAFGLCYSTGYLLTAYGWRTVPSPAIAGALATMSFAFWYKWDRTWSGMASMIAVGVLGSGTEAFLNTKVQSMTYQVSEMGGVPVWLFFLYTAGTSIYGQITRRLLEPKHDVERFEGGAAGLPNCYARARYAL